MHLFRMQRVLQRLESENSPELPLCAAGGILACRMDWAKELVGFAGV
jgi:hypothetical protein